MKITAYILIFSILFASCNFNTAISKIEDAKSIKEVKKIFTENEDNGNHFEKDEILEIRNQLKKFKPNEKELISINEWLGSPETFINLIIVPDLSSRIDLKAHPKQIENDKVLINYIYQKFKAITFNQKEGKHIFRVDVSDENQANGLFRIFKDSLTFEMEKDAYNKTSNVFFFKDCDKKLSFLDSMYNSAIQNIDGADYENYFRYNLRLKKNTLFENYENVLIFITDGYLEVVKNNQVETISLNSSERIAFSNGNYDWTNNKINNFPENGYKGLKILMLENIIRQDGDFEANREWWKRCCERMGIEFSNEYFVKSNGGGSTTQTKNIIDEFLKQTCLTE